jgi:hypothetical protein
MEEILHQKLINRIYELNNLLQSPSEESLEIFKFELKSIFIFLFDACVKTSDKIKNDLLKRFEKYSDIYPDIVSTADNPNCSCRAKTVEFFIQNTEEVLNIFNEILAIHPQDNKFYEQIFTNINNMIEKYNSRNKLQTNNQKLSLIGQIIEFKTKEEYFKIIHDIYNEEKHFNGLKIIESNDINKIYFY